MSILTHDLNNASDIWIAATHISIERQIIDWVTTHPSASRLQHSSVVVRDLQGEFRCKNPQIGFSQGMAESMINLQSMSRTSDRQSRRLSLYHLKASRLS